MDTPASFLLDPQAEAMQLCVKEMVAEQIRDELVARGMAQIQEQMLEQLKKDISNQVEQEIKQTKQEINQDVMQEVEQDIKQDVKQQTSAHQIGQSKKKNGVELKSSRPAGSAAQKISHTATSSTHLITAPIVSGPATSEWSECAATLSSSKAPPGVDISSIVGKVICPDDSALVDAVTELSAIVDHAYLCSRGEEQVNDVVQAIVHKAASGHFWAYAGCQLVKQLSSKVYDAAHLTNVLQHQLEAACTVSNPTTSTLQFIIALYQFDAVGHFWMFWFLQRLLPEKSLPNASQILSLHCILQETGAKFTKDGTLWRPLQPLLLRIKRLLPILQRSPSEHGVEIALLRALVDQAASEWNVTV